MVVSSLKPQAQELSSVSESAIAADSKRIRQVAHSMQRRPSASLDDDKENGDIDVDGRPDSLDPKLNGVNGEAWMAQSREFPDDESDGAGDDDAIQEQEHQQEQQEYELDEEDSAAVAGYAQPEPGANVGSRAPVYTDPAVQDLIDRIQYSSRYSDDTHEYRHVILPKEYYQHYVPKSMKNRLLTEDEWRGIGIQQSPGWVHYELHGPEPHIFLFKRLLVNTMNKIAYDEYRKNAGKVARPEQLQ